MMTLSPVMANELARAADYDLRRDLAALEALNGFQPAIRNPGWSSNLTEWLRELRQEGLAVTDRLTPTGGTF